MSKKHPRPISLQQAHDMLQKDPSVLLVCAYDKEEEFRQNDLEGAVSLSEFRKRVDSLPKDENIIFYCACPDDEGATREAQKYFREGFINARILMGGVNAWKEAGYALVGSRA
jgi:rhodanese-related sulfurtransferase